MDYMYTVKVILFLILFSFFSFFTSKKAKSQDREITRDNIAFIKYPGFPEGSTWNDIGYSPTHNKVFVGVTNHYDKVALYVYDVASHRMQNKGLIDEMAHLRDFQWQGRIYGSRGLNEIFYFNPDDQSFHVLEDKVPTVWGRTSLGQIESWVHYNGKLYGGTAGEGQLFVLDPSTGQVTNLGKPIMMNRIKGLAVGRDGKLYGIAGAPPGYAHLFSYDPDGEGFRDYGNPQFTMKAPGIEQGIAWRGFNFATVASSEDGRYVVMGEDEALSQLMIFAVEEK